MNFKDLLVLDASTVLAGPSVGTFFAELGARVLKIENPHTPDVTRTWKQLGEDPKSCISAYFSSVNYGKEYLQLDLKNRSDREEFFALIAKADILLTNFKSGDAQKFGIVDEQLRLLNPRLICGKISGFGSDSDRVAYDLILQAETGFMSMNGTAESGPIKMPVALIDVLAAHHLKEGLLCALLEREVDGIGRSVSVSLYDAALSSLVNQASNYLMSGQVPQRIGSLHPNIAPYGELFTAKDQELLCFAIGSDAHFTKLCVILKCEELSRDERFSTNPQRVKNRKELFDLLSKQVRNFNSEELLETLHKERVPAAQIKNLEAVFSEEQSKKLIRQEIIDGVMSKRVSSIAFRWE